MKVVYYLWQINWSDHVMLNPNAPATNPSVEFTDKTQRQTRLKWETTFSPNKDQQRFRNQSYRCGCVKVNNTISVLQQLLHTIIRSQNFVTEGTYPVVSSDNLSNLNYYKQWNNNKYDEKMKIFYEYIIVE